MSSLTRSTIAKIESGVRKAVTLEEAVILSQALDMPLEDLTHARVEGSLRQGDVGDTDNARAVPDHVVDGGPSAGYVSRPAVGWPHRIGVVPPLAASYMPRTQQAVNLMGALAEPASTVVLSGMGGVGKTQLAAACSHQLWQTGQLDLLVWITATRREAIVTGYAQGGSDVANPSETETAELVATRFLAWLASTDKRWLVVLDELADPAELRGLWPQGANGRVLVTTRRRDAALADRGAVIDVGLFTQQEALTYLSDRLEAECRPDRLIEAADLADDLGRLPLALAQAAAYMRDRDLSCAAYRRRLAGRGLELTLPADAAAGDYSATVATTWSLSVELADRLAPAGLARPLLTLAAVLGHNGIPAVVFSRPAARAFLLAARSGEGERQGGNFGENVPEGGVLEEDVQDSLANLHRLSLIAITRDPEVATADSVHVHALVQRATREKADPTVRFAAARAAADALLQAWPIQDYRPENARLAQSLRDNVDALTRAVPGALWDRDAHTVLLRAGQSRNVGGLLDQAVEYWAELAARADQWLGSEHPDALTSRDNLASAYQAVGRLREALTLFEQTLADRVRILGPGHPATLVSRGNLASAYQAVGRLAEAVPLLERSVADSERVLGPYYPATLASRHNLARAYQAVGRLDEALSLLERTLTDRERLLGRDHPDTLGSRINLGEAYRRAGRLAEALSLLERTLADLERLLGPAHPQVAVALYRLGTVQAQLGHLPAAADVLSRAVEVDTAAYGPDHAEVATDLEALAAVEEQQGNVEAAAASRARAQQIRNLAT